MGDPRPGRAGADGLADRIRKLEQNVALLNSPSGTQRFGTSAEVAATVEYLAGLRTTVGTGAGFTTAKANDGTFSWFTSAVPVLIFEDIEAPTGRIMVTATAGEVRLNPLGGTVQGLVGYRVRDANNVTVPGGILAQPGRYGRIISKDYIATGVRTPELPLTLDPAVSPPPYEVTPYFGVFVDTANSGACSFTFTDLSCRIDVLENN